MGTARSILLAGALASHACLCAGQEEQAPTAPDQESLPTIPVESAEPAEAPVPIPEADGKQTLETVIVTASKRRESVRNIPISVDAFTAKDLESRNATGSQDALLFSPGVSVSAYYSPTLTQVQVRGTATQTEATNQATPVGAFLDDVTLANPSLVGGNPNIDVFDLERVEVLKGPQGTLFGGAALAGALRSIPNAPKLYLFGASGFVSRLKLAESEEQGTDWGVAVNVPLGTTAALRAMTVTRAYPGVIDNIQSDVPDANSYTVTQRRGMALWEPGAGWKLEGMIHTLESSVQDVTHTDNPGRSNSYGNEAGLSPSSADYRFIRIGLSKTLFDTVEAHVVGAKVDKEDFISVQADRIAVQTPVFDLTKPLYATADTYTGELRFNSIEPSQSDLWLLDDWSWVTGFYRLVSDQGVSSRYQVAAGPLLTFLTSLLGLPGLTVEALSADITARAIENAFYADTTRGLGPVDLTLGMRLFEQESVGTYTQSSNGIQLPTTGSTTKDRGFLPKAALTWHVTNSLALRALAVKGFRFAGFNAVIANDGSIPLGYGSDSLWNYEIGVRSEWFGRRLRADVTGFLIDWSKIQVAQTTVADEIYTVNAGRARNVGAEAALAVRLPFGLAVTTSAAYVDARIREPFEATDGTVPAGTRLPGTPHLTGSALIAGNYELPFASVAPSVSWTYQGETVSELQNGIRIPAYSLLNAGLTLTAKLPGRPALSVGGSNLLNKHGYTGAIQLQTVTDYIPIQPRSVFVKLSATF